MFIYLIQIEEILKKILNGLNGSKVLSIYKIENLIASNDTLISRKINKRRLERDKI